MFKQSLTTRDNPHTADPGSSDPVDHGGTGAVVDHIGHSDPDHHPRRPRREKPKPREQQKRRKFPYKKRSIGLSR
ncbi:MAG: hypothetical protein AAF587_25715 [Bacteroidota bacterium]